MTHVLIIDDDPTARLTISRSLAKDGYIVEQATNGREGLALAHQLLPALIICDWNMPEMNGLEVCRHVKSSPSLVFTHFILLTARDEVSDLVRGLENGADDFLSKPANPSELRARVRAGLRLNGANRELQQQKLILEEELAQAAKYVQSLLPDKLDGVVRARSCFLPSIHLGGDCFDYFWLNDDHFIFYVLDVSGHGVGAALLSVSIQNLLRSARSTAGFSSIDLLKPSRVLVKLNEYFQMTNHQDMYFTIWYGVYDRSCRQLTYAAAGHPPALLFHGGLVERLGLPGLPVGVFDDFAYEESKTDILSGSKLYVFSDGTYEIYQEDGTMWGIEGLTNALSQDGEAPLKFVMEKVKKMKLEDDFSILEIQFS